MTADESTKTPGSNQRARIIAIVVSAVVVVIVVIVAIALASRPGSSQPSAGSTTGASTGPTRSGSSASSSPSASGEPSPSATPPLPIASPVPLDTPVEPAAGVSVSVGGFEAVQGEASLAGDVAGPAVRFTLTVVNSTAAPVSLASALVNVYYGTDLSPADSLQKPGGVPLPGEVGAGQTVQGVFVYTIPEDQRDAVLITVDYQVGSPVIAFQGTLPR